MGSNGKKLKDDIIHINNILKGGLWLNHSKGCFLKVKGQKFDIFVLLDQFLKN